MIRMRAKGKKTSSGEGLEVESKTARLEARLTPQQKDLIERAAAYEGRSLSEFVVHALTQAAQTVIQEQEVLRLNVQQSRAFVESLLRPPAPNAALRRAARRYRRTVRSR